MASTGEPITLPVSNLAAAQDLYTDILKTINYRPLNYVRKDRSDGSSLDAVQYGPSVTERVDLIISQSSRRTNSAKKGRRPHIRFHAPSMLAVRDFYDIATLNGAVAKIAPMRQGNDFVAGVRDEDENQIEVACDLSTIGIDASEDGAMRLLPGPQSDKIDSWRESVADEATPGGIIVPPTEVASQFQPQARSSADHPQPRPPSHAAFSVRRSESPERMVRLGSSHKSEHESQGTSAKNVLAGTLLAGGAALLAGVVVNEVKDSKEREADFNRTMHKRDALEREAQAAFHHRSSERAAKAQKEADRDSGYYSITPPTNTGRNYQEPIKGHASGSSRRAATRGATYPAPPQSKARRPSSSTSDKHSHKKGEGLGSHSHTARRSTAPSTIDKRSHITVSEAPSKPSLPRMPTVPPSAYPDAARRGPETQARRPLTRHTSSHKSDSHSVSTTRPASSYKSSTPAPPRSSASKHSEASTKRAAHKPPSRAGTTSTYRAARDKPLPSTPAGGRRVANSRADAWENSTVLPSDSASQVSSRHPGSSRMSGMGG